MKQLVFMLSSSIAALLLSFTMVGLAAQSEGRATDGPTVVLAVGPVYPAIALAMSAKGEVVIEVTIDAKGKVVSASVVSGNDYLRDSGKKAAMNWRFAPVNEKEKTRTVRLTFAYRYADSSEPVRAQPEITTTFRPPYRVELISQPYIVH